MPAEQVSTTRQVASAMIFLMALAILLALLADWLHAAQPTPDATCRVRGKDGSLVRSMPRRNAFRRATGFPDGRPGWCVDHVVPLVCGGCDVQSNMAWMPCDVMRQKDDLMRVRAKEPLCNVPLWPRP